MRLARCFLMWLVCVTAYAFNITGVSNVAFGTATLPFSTLTMTNSGVCVSSQLLDLSTNYSVTAVSTGGGNSQFLLKNTTSSSYSLAYTVSWASPTTLVSLSPNTARNFSNASPFTAPCPGAGANAQLSIQIPSTNLVLAAQGSYSDTLTITIGASV